MKLRHIGLIILAVVIVLGVAAVVLVWRTEIPAVADDAQANTDPALVSQGYVLAQIGNCASCHTARGGKPFAGGRAMPTPFGTIHATNITPDRETGIGTWSQDAFERAMREGIDREGRHLYPAFPYNHFTKASDQDIHALYAFFRSVPAVHNEIAANDLMFPFNIRAMITGWNLLFLDTSALEPADDQSDAWNRGRYLVEGLAHCGACHTPRNLMGAEKESKKYEGTTIDGWYAAPLSGDGARKWSAEQLQDYLASGFSRDHGAAAGPMAETVNNLAQSSPADVQAIATYVASLTDDAQNAIKPIDNGSADASGKGHQLWVGACAQCHESSDGVGASSALPLSVSGAVRQPASTNVVRTIFNGIDAYRDRGGPYMPAFSDVLSDDEIAELARYVRRRYSNAPAWTGLKDEISKARSAANPEE